MRSGRAFPHWLFCELGLTSIDFHNDCRQISCSGPSAKCHVWVELASVSVFPVIPVIAAASATLTISTAQPQSRHQSRLDRLRMIKTRSLWTVISILFGAQSASAVPFIQRRNRDRLLATVWLDFRVSALERDASCRECKKKVLKKL